MLNEEQYLQICCAEEAAEVAHRISKILRFGLNEVQPGQDKTNRTRLEDELVDFTAIVHLMGMKGIVNMRHPDLQKSFEAKIDKVRKYMQYSRDRGILEQ